MEASAAPRPAAAPSRGLVSARLLRVASDEKLVALVRGGSESAFEVIYDRHHRGILSFCRHMLGSQEEAEDAVQHTFMAAYRHLLANDKAIQLRAWLYAIARNRCLSVLRARRERPSDELDDAVATVGLAEEVQRRQDLQDMLRDLAALPEEQRSALVLAEIGDLPHDEIGAVLGVQKDKVKALVFQARSSLHSSREARETDCSEIRELIANLSGGSLRRTNLRRHLRECPGCRDFQAEVKRQRKVMAAVLPVIPAIGLKESALAAAFSAKAAGAGSAASAGAVAAAGMGGGAVATGTAGALIAKVLVVGAVAGGGAVGVNAATQSDTPVREATPAAEQSNGGASGTAPNNDPGEPVVPVATPEKDAKQDQADARAKERDRHGRRRGHTDRGKEWAKTRGKGKKRGLYDTQPRPANKAEREERRLERARARAEKKAAKRRRAKDRRKARQRQRRAAEQRAATPAPKPRPEPTPRAEAKPKPAPTPEPTAEPTTTAPLDVGPEIDVNPGKKDRSTTT